MKKIIDNYTLVQLLNAFADQDCFWVSPTKKPHLLISIPVRSALKKNLEVLREYGNEYSEMLQALQTELQKQFMDAGKATQNENGVFAVNTGYESDYEKDLNGKLMDLLQQKLDVELRSFTTQDLEHYIQLNEKYLTESDVELLEFFVEDPKED